MEETKKNDVQKKNWFAGLKSEFQKIVWLDKKCDYCSTGSWHSVWR